MKQLVEEIAKALVEAQGGRLWMETQDSRGTVFQFIVPLMPQPSMRESE